MVPKVCASLALLTEIERAVVDDLYVRMPAAHQFKPKDEQLLLEALLGGLKAGEPLMRPDVFPVALFAVFVKSVESLGHKGAPPGTGLARHVASLINNVAAHHPELLTAYNAWQLQSGTWVSTAAFLTSNQLCPDVALLTPVAMPLIQAGLQKHGLRSSVGGSVQNGSLYVTNWLCTFPPLEPLVAKDILNIRTQSRALELASRAPLQITPHIQVADQAQELLGRLARGVVQARAGAAVLDPASPEERALMELVAFADAGKPFAEFARHLAFNVTRRRWSSDFEGAVAPMSMLCGITPSAGAARLGLEFNKAITALAAETTMWSSDLANFTSPNSNGMLDRRDFITKLLDFMRLHDEINFKFLAGLKLALGGRTGRQGPLIPTLEAQLLHEQMKLRTDGPGDLPVAPPRRRLRGV